MIVENHSLQVQLIQDAMIVEIIGIDFGVGYLTNYSNDKSLREEVFEFLMVTHVVREDLEPPTTLIPYIRKFTKLEEQGIDVPLRFQIHDKR